MEKEILISGLLLYLLITCLTVDSCWTKVRWEETRGGQGQKQSRGLHQENQYHGQQTLSHYVEVCVISSWFRSSLPRRGQVNTNKCCIPFLSECLYLMPRIFHPHNELASVQGKELMCIHFNEHGNKQHASAGSQPYIYCTLGLTFLEVKPV